MTRLNLTIVFALCLAGSWISGELLRLGVDPQAAVVLTRTCRADAAAGGCAAALHSDYGAISVPVPRPRRDLSIGVRRVEVPVAFLGLAYFVSMGVWFVVAGNRRSPGRAWHRLPLHAALGALSVSLLLVGLMATGAAPWCPWCAVVHAINALLVVAVWRLAAVPAPRAAALTPGHAVSAAVLAMAAVGGLALHHRSETAHRRERVALLPYRTLVQSLQQDPAFLLREHAAQPAHEFPARPGEAVGEDRHRLVVFTDFGCPACFCTAARVHDKIAPVFDGRLDVLVRYFPLSTNSGEAARAAEAARRLGGPDAFFEMYRRLFVNQRRLGRALYAELAAQVGLDPEALLDAMESDEVRETVGADIELGRRAGVTATPTMFLDGRRVTDLCRSPVFWEAVAGSGPVQEALAREQ